MPAKDVMAEKKLFKLLRGEHAQNEETNGPHGMFVREVTEDIPDGNGGVKSKVVGYLKNYKALVLAKVPGKDDMELRPAKGFTWFDQFVWSNIDLCKRYGKEKFALADSEEIEQYNAGVDGGEAARSEKNDQLDEMTDARLKALARTENIDVKGMDRAQIIDALRTAMAVNA